MLTRRALSPRTVHLVYIMPSAVSSPIDPRAIAC
jgi:hypothetical protein